MPADGEAGVGRPALYLLTLALAFCSMVYELLLAQSMAATMGDTFLRYNLTIGLYLASLGLGSLLLSSRPAGSALERLADVELALSWLGTFSPLLVYAWDLCIFRLSPALGFEFRGPLYQFLIYAFNHSLIVSVGVLSGFELPLLMSLGGGKADRAPSRGSAASEGGQGAAARVLAVDYFGTLLGACLFPLLLLPWLGVFTTACAAGLLNAACGLWLLRRRGRGSGGRPRTVRLRLAGYAAVAALGLLLIARREELHRVVFEHFSLF